MEDTWGTNTNAVKGIWCFNSRKPDLQTSNLSWLIGWEATFIARGCSPRCLYTRLLQCLWTMKYIRCVLFKHVFLGHHWLRKLSPVKEVPKQISERELKSIYVAEERKQTGNWCWCCLAGAVRVLRGALRERRWGCTRRAEVSCSGATGTHCLSQDWPGLGPEVSYPNEEIQNTPGSKVWDFIPFS